MHTNFANYWYLENKENGQHHEDMEAGVSTECKLAQPFWTAISGYKMPCLWLTACCMQMCLFHYFQHQNI